MADNSMMKTAYHVTLGQTLMYATDALSAVSRFPTEWALEPWPTTAEIEADTADTSKVDIPDDWKALVPQKRRMIAIRLGASNTIKASEADAMIVAELAKRAKPAPVAQTSPTPPA